MSEQSTLQGSASFKDSSLDSIKIEKFAKILMISLEKMRDLKNRGTNTSMKRQYLRCRKFDLEDQKIVQQTIIIIQQKNVGQSIELGMNRFILMHIAESFYFWFWLSLIHYQSERIKLIHFDSLWFFIFIRFDLPEELKKELICLRIKIKSNHK